MADESVPDPRSKGILIEHKDIIILICGVMIVTVIFGGLILALKDAPHSVLLPMISILGIVSLLLCLSGISYVFVKVKLDNKDQALGLPPGSIQSVIALSLVVLFAILSVFVLTAMGETKTRSLSGLSVPDRDSQIARLGANFAGWQADANGTYTIFVQDPASAGRDDVGKQLIVLIGTLMTSAVSFYFGTRATVAGAAVAAGSDDAARPSPGARTADAPNPSSGAGTQDAAPETENRADAADGARKDQQNDTKPGGTP
ncbi:hypothetical protein [Methylobacterium nonmethylotrophicum]|uniref:Uncharacterized protein n=1 Tax=Methylobacterium nonmethylotrophicum TaxID=1141884 RepID=A0A4Z0NGW4_9HYPH|nr:hypothetical protein [Methylobacterium nonmethylotrophicum]TGD94892.1 hypothetical protein EU555_30425 [Methylobacterium nonmethylotrophicum]